MSKHITFILEPDKGKFTAEVSGLSPDALSALKSDLGSSQQVNCGKPSRAGQSEPSQSAKTAHDESQSIWLYQIYHGSVSDGPGRRSVIQVAGCSIRCPGCYVPETHNRKNGRLVRISSIIEEIIANRHQHDGVTILGGEPFDQPGPVAELVFRLRRLGIHIVIYTGNTMATLAKRRDPSVHYIITHVDLTIDGPFIHQLTANAGEYRGSQNQRLIFESEDRAKAPFTSAV